MDSLTSPFEIIPEIWHLPFIVVTGFVGFWFVIGFSSASPEPPSSQATRVRIKEEPTTISLPKIPETPTKGQPMDSEESNSFGTPPPVELKEFGSVATPSGRRSARVMAKGPKK